jgi:hypothetical protein
MNIPFNSDFPHAYEVDQIHQLSEQISSATVRQQPIALRITPKGKEPWTPRLRLQTHGEWKSFSALYSCPNPNHLCIVADGQTYIVDAQSQTQFDLPDPSADHVLNVYSCVEGDFLLFSGDPWLWAWGRDGLLWDTAVHGDELEIIDVKPEIIAGRWRWGVGGEAVLFQCDPKTGEMSWCPQLARVQILSKDECAGAAARCHVDVHRMVAWHVLSSFYLDVILTEDDLQKMVGILAASPISFAELAHIAYYEVYSVCNGSLDFIQGREWNSFDLDWLAKNCNRYNKRHPFGLFQRKDQLPDLPWEFALNEHGVLAFLTKVGQLKKSK